MTEKTLVKKLVQVMEKVKYIQKRGFNKFHKYNYATEADVNEKVREELAEVNVIMIPNMVSHETREHTNRSGNIEYIITVNMEFRFIDGDSGEELTFNMSGSGQDAGDKGIFKAISGAQKYALMKVFMIPTGDDPEQDDSADERNNKAQLPKQITSQQVGELKALALRFAKLREQTEPAVYKVLGIDNIEKLNEGVAFNHIATLKKWIDKAMKETA